jgi:hypothetical protein
MDMATSLKFRSMITLPVWALIVGLCGGCPLLQPNPGDTTPDTVPDFEAAEFTAPTVIDNPYFPQEVGVIRTYRGETAGGTEEIIIEVLDETRVVDGVTCRVVRDRAYLEGVLIEDTDDFFAQDDAGNVWYMGEEVDNYNFDDAGNPIGITHEGSWEAGKDIANLGVIAKPGHVMKASPAAGQKYHQEYYVGEAEDEAEVVALNVAVALVDGTSYSTLQTREFTRLEPDLNEYKYFAMGIGLVVEGTVDGDERIELVSIVQP